MLLRVNFHLITKVLRVVADARIPRCYGNAACVIKRKLSDFYTDITPAMDAEVDTGNPDTAGGTLLNPVKELTLFFL